MKTICIERLTLSYDSYRENGYYLGKQLRETFPHMLNTLQHLGPYDQDSDEIKQELHKYCPPLLEELKGLQDGLQLSERQTLQMFSGYDMPKFKGMGCTSIMTEDYYVRNYDFSPAVYDHLFIAQEKGDNSWICGNSQFGVGRLDGMNSEGLVVGLHFVNNQPYEKGFLCSMIVRIVLETCHNVKEAIQLLQTIPHAASYNYSLLDRKGNFAVVEASPSKCTVLWQETSLCCVNMFQKSSMNQFNRPSTRTSTDRMEAMDHFTKEPKQVDELHDWFSQPSSPMFYTDYDNFFGTLHTVSYIPKDLKILLTAAGGNKISITI